MSSPSIPQRSQAVSQRIDDLELTDREHHFLVGWMTSLAPDAVNDALDGLLAYRERRDDPRSIINRMEP